jgi:hypothetical protein
MRQFINQDPEYAHHYQDESSDDHCDGFLEDFDNPLHKKQRHHQLNQFFKNNMGPGTMEAKQSQLSQRRG